jgi:cbb3-type cytochrome oxidase cytochrome c subunit
MKRIAGLIIRILLAIAIQKITKLVAEAIAQKTIEKTKNRKSQLLSLVGVPPEALRAIKGLM